MSNRGTNLLIVTLLAAFVGACAANPGSPGVASKDGRSVEASIHGTKVVLPIPSGYCPLSDSNAVDKATIAALSRVNEGRNEVLAVFVDCQELKAFRANGVEFFNSGSYLAPATLAETRLTMPRGRYAKLMASAIGAKKNHRTIIDAQEAALRRLESEGGFSTSASTPAVLHQDATGAFMGNLVSMPNKRGGSRTTTVVGMTLVRQKAVNINFSAPYKGPKTVQTLLAAQREHVRRLIAVN